MKKLAVISGASKGIGKAIAEIFGLHGLDVAICARSLQHLNDFKADFENKYQAQCHVFVADVSKKSEIEAFADFVLDLNLPIAALINNAGVFMPGQIISEAAGNLETQIETNVYSAYYLTRKLISALKVSDSSHIFNICSIASQMAYPQSGSYTISKFALLGFSKSLREELKSTQIKVTAILPGATFTDSWAGVDLPENRFMKAQDVAEVVWSAYNLSPQAVVEEIVLRPLLGDI